MPYKHLSLEERHYIEIEHRRGTSGNRIAQVLGRSQSTIAREFQRNTGLKGYRRHQASRLAAARHQCKHKKRKLTFLVIQYIQQGLAQDWSPEQIAGRLQKERGVSLHHETIYRYILDDKKAGGHLYKQLRHQHKRYRKRYGNTHNRTGIPNRVDIDERPEAANQRARVGDWEADTIIGKQHQGAIVTLDDRKTKLRLAAPLSGKRAGVVSQVITALFKPIEPWVKSITFDNGKEFAKHEALAKDLSCQTYFAKPYHSWERGQNENANGLLRQYFPKTQKLTDVSMRQVVEAVNKLNSRPRKCLDYKTPYEYFEELTGVNVKNLMGYALMTRRSALVNYR